MFEKAYRYREWIRDIREDNRQHEYDYEYFRDEFSIGDE